jgi:hypothetical protein
MIIQKYGVRSMDGAISRRGESFNQGHRMARQLAQAAERTIRRCLIILALGGIVVAGNSTSLPHALASHVDARTAWWGQLHCARVHHASCRKSPHQR